MALEEKINADINSAMLARESYLKLTVILSVDPFHPRPTCLADHISLQDLSVSYSLLFLLALYSNILYLYTRLLLRIMTTLTHSL